MASLVEELIFTLQEEEVLYQQMIPIAEEKTRAVVENSIKDLQTITETEQRMISKVGALEAKREEVVDNMAVVLNRRRETLTLSAIIEILQKQPDEQKKLRTIHDKLKKTVERLKDINAQNRILIQDSLEMVEFNMNFIRSTRMSSGSSNYTRDASQMDAPVSQQGLFDAKQ